MLSGFRLALAFLLAFSVSVALTAVPASAKAHLAPKRHAPKKTRAKSTKKKPASKKSAKKSAKKKKLAKKKRPARKARRRARKKLAPRRAAPRRPTIVHAPPAPVPQPIRTVKPPANAYSGSPEDANLPMPKTEAIPLRAPGQPEEEKSVRLDMTRPYGATTPVPAPSDGPKRGIASEAVPTPEK
jgi:hypothetical protein